MCRTLSHQYRFAAISFATFLCLITQAVGQNSSPKIYTEHPAVTKGVFANWTFPSGPILGNAATGDDRKSFRLRNGIFAPKFDKDGYIERTGAYLRAVDFVDVTGDGVKEGIATVGPIHEGTAVWYGIYIYTMARSAPTKLIRSFATGDRGVGGLKRIYGNRGRLVVELWGWNSGPDSPPTTHIEAQAGSSYFTRRTYSWNGRDFKQIGKARIFRSPE